MRVRHDRQTETEQQGAPAAVRLRYLLLLVLCPLICIGVVVTGVVRIHTGLGLFLGVAGLVWVGIMTIRVTQLGWGVSSTELIIRNPFRIYKVKWSEVDRIEFGRVYLTMSRVPARAVIVWRSGSRSGIPITGTSSRTGQRVFIALSKEMLPGGSAFDQEWATEVKADGDVD